MVCRHYTNVKMTVFRFVTFGWILPPAKPIVLPMRQAHVWRALLKHPRVSTLVHRELPLDETRSRQTKSELAHAVLRNILARYTGVSAMRLSFHREPSGKPFLLHGPAFNMAHTKDVILVAVAHTDVGIDVEKADRSIVNIDRLVSRFSEAERDSIQNASNPRQALLCLWTRKEAFVKCTGEGIRRGLSSFDIDLGKSCDWIVSVDGSAQGAREFRAFNIDLDAHFASLVSKSPSPISVTRFEWEPEC